eukprot:scaffold131_cov335-Pavlova_lutheri.AAC.13
MQAIWLPIAGTNLWEWSERNVDVKSLLGQIRLTDIGGESWVALLGHYIDTSMSAHDDHKISL